MESVLLDILLDNKNTHGALNSEYITTLIESIISCENLHQGVEKIKVHKFGLGCCEGIYEPEDKMLILYKNQLRISLRKMKKYRHIFSDFEWNVFKKVIVMRTILHELEHANQEFLRDENTLEGKILATVNPEKVPYMSVNKKRDMYLKAKRFVERIKGNFSKYETYSINPQERYAEIKSNIVILRMLKQIQLMVPNLYEFWKVTTAESLIDGYVFKDTFLVSPTVMYYKLNGLDSKLDEFSWYDDKVGVATSEASKDYSLFERLKSGLPISREEHQLIRTKINNSIKH